ncbi:MAG: hypothetical protein HY821_11330 [Acidobacteria bacterium]|nr:hypothetical protein [Acidobacteriota bacterium]
MSQHYGWPAYWSMGHPLVPVFVEGQPLPPDGDRHLRSVRELSTYQLHAADSGLGGIADFIMEDSNWFIRYLVIKTGNWLNGQKVLIATRSVASIDWSSRQVVLAHSLEEV